MGKKRFSKSIVSFLLAATLVLQVAPLPQKVVDVVNHSEVVYAATGLENIKAKDGLILQMHCQSFNNMKSQLADIAAAGYKTIQTSPIQPHMQGDQWWALYQPTDQSVGNVLGTREEFKALCEAAESYGIDIIVDAVMNHMASNGADLNTYSSQCAPKFKNSSLYHNVGQCSDWKNRYAVTQQGIGMPDLNTQHPTVQAYAIEFLNDAIACGADGFRFDAVKHIETNIGVDAGKSWAGNYWTNVLGSLNNKNNLFLYGEALDEPNSDSDNMDAYATFMSVTDHNYGATLRNAVKGWNLRAAQSWAYQLPVGRRVTYVENHDNFEHKESGISDTQRKLAWGILAARDNVTPMYLSRRTGGLGSIGTTDWKDPEIKAINWFHNAMVGQTEYLRYANNDACMIVDRGTVGTAIINQGSNFYLNSATNLANGTYTDKGGSGATFTVSGGMITGNVPGSRVVVLYKDVNVDATNITLDKSSADVYVGATTTLTRTLTPSNATSTVTWSTSNRSVATVSNGVVTGVAAGTAVITATTSNGLTAKATITVKELVFEAGYMYFVKPSGWSNTINAYIWNDAETYSNSKWPGAVATEYASGIYRIAWPSNYAGTDLNVIFNDGTRQTADLDAINNGYYTINGYSHTIPVGNIDVTGIQLDQSTATIAQGGTTTLAATVLPSNATNKAITWTTSNSSVATVLNGVVTGVAEGTATITATTSNGLTATAAITVTKATTSYMYFSKPSNWGNTIYAYIWNDSETYKNSAWPGVATTLQSDGTYAIQWPKDYSGSDLNVIFNDGTRQTADLDAVKSGYYTSSGFSHIVSNVDATGITLDKTTASVEAGSTVTLTKTLTPSNASSTVTWTTSNASVATVSTAGVVTGVAEGTATITATTSNGLTAIATITVTKATKTYMYFTKPSSWGSTIYAYMWTSDGKYKNAAWPGVVTEYSNGTYRIEYPTGYTGLKVIFNDGSRQTADLDAVAGKYYSVN